MSNLPFCRGPISDVPRTGRIDREDGFVGLFEEGDDGVERFPHGGLEGEAEKGVDDEVGGGEGVGEVVGEGDVQGFELAGEAGEEVGVGGFWVEDGGVVAVVVEMAGADEAVAA